MSSVTSALVVTVEESTSWGDAYASSAVVGFLGP